MNEWKEIGYVGVDAGLMWVGDPCYCVTPDANSHPAKTWSEFCSMLYPVNNNKDSFEETGFKKFGNIGIAVSSGYGDGLYPVFIKKDREGRVMGVMVLFDEPEEDDEDSDYGEVY